MGRNDYGSVQDRIILELKTRLNINMKILRPRSVQNWSPKLSLDLPN